MTADLTLRLDEVSAVIAGRVPSVLRRGHCNPQVVRPALDAAHPERYEVGYQIGAGGMAKVVIGVVEGACGLQRPVAIKRVRSDLAIAILGWILAIKGCSAAGLAPKDDAHGTTRGGRENSSPAHLLFERTCSGSTSAQQEISPEARDHSYPQGRWLARLCLGHDMRNVQGRFDPHRLPSTSPVRQSVPVKLPHACAQ